MFANTVMTHTCKTISRLSGIGARLVNTAPNFNEVDVTRLEKTINQVTLLGRVGREPMKRGTEHHPVVVFSLATHVNFKQNGEFMQKTDWHRVCVFKPNLLDNVYTYLKKGQRAMVLGKLSYGEITDEQGSSKSVVSIIADDVVFFEPSRQENQ